MRCLRKFHLPKTPSHPELESVALCFLIFFFKLQTPQLLVQLLAIPCLTCVTRGRCRNKHCFHILHFSHLRAVTFSLYQTAQNLTYSQMDKATVLLSRGLTTHSKSSWNCPQTSVAFNAHTMWGKQPQWLWPQGPALGIRYSRSLLVA